MTNYSDLLVRIAARAREDNSALPASVSASALRRAEAQLGFALHPLLAAVLLFEPNPGDPDLAWYVDSPSLAEWFAHYVDDTGWRVKAEAGEDVPDFAPWPYAHRTR
jgi:hypothetical protein